METGVPMVGKIEKVIHPDGKISWNYTTKLPLRNAEGQICGICGINKDFGHIHEMEETLRKERNRLRALTAELQARNAQLQADLQMAREVQEALLPRDYPSLAGGHSLQQGGLAFAHCYRPTAAVGGDFFDIFPLSPTRFGVFICDVMGHGLRAALITAIIRGLLEELRPVMHDPGCFMSMLNVRLHTILKRVEEPLIATAFYLIADTKTQEVRFANAAHPAPIYLGRGGGVVGTLSNDGRRPDSALGLFDKLTYTTSTQPFEDIERIVLFTDGLYEVESPQGQEFGRDSLRACFRRHADLPTEELFAAVLSDVSAFSAKKDFDDDVCIVAVERCQSGAVEVNPLF
jgi:sigma-B regulation protein RsbU (phosphoserine phosphatase)